MVRSFVADILVKAQEEAYKNNSVNIVNNNNNNNNISTSKESLLLSIKV